jgi:4-hydroxybenzoate polyprenyltransferase
MFSILKDYAIFAFVINFIREIVKDMQDIQGDTSQGMITLPITIGIKWTTKIVAVLLAISTVVLLIYVNEHLMVNELYYATVYTLVLVVAPLLFCLVKVWNATSKADFSQLSKILKWIIFFGIVSVFIVTLNINYNA